jgi:hypothetical protein
MTVAQAAPTSGTAPSHRSSRRPGRRSTQAPRPAAADPSLPAVADARPSGQLTFPELDRAEREAELAAARADAKAHALTRVFPPGVPFRYRFFAVPSARGKPLVRFCYSVHRNAAGFFLLWRESLRRSGLVRDQWDACRDKRSAIWTCRTSRDEALASGPERARPAAAAALHPDAAIAAATATRDEDRKRVFANPDRAARHG